MKISPHLPNLLHHFPTDFERLSLLFGNILVFELDPGTGEGTGLDVDRGRGAGWN